MRIQGKEIHSMEEELQEEVARLRRELARINANRLRVIKAEWKEFIRKVLVLDLNVVCTAREKNQYKEGDFMVKDGTTFDGEKSLHYYFDTVIQVVKQNGKNFAEVQKDRTNSVPVRFELSYDVFGKILANGNGGKMSAEEMEARLRGDRVWMTEACPYKTAGGYTWEALAKNLAGVIDKEGKKVFGRDYLQKIEGWAQASMEVRTKARLALLVAENPKDAAALEVSERDQVKA